MLSNSRTRTSAWNLVFGYLNIVVLLVRNILMVPLYLTFIPLVEYGAWMATGLVLINLIIVDYGLAGVTIQRVSYLLGKSDIDALGSAIGTSLLAGTCLSILLTILCLSFSGYVPSLMQLEGDVGERVLHCFIIAIFSNAVLIVGISSLGIIKSLNFPITAGVVNPISDILSLVLTVILLQEGFGLYAIAIGLLVRALMVMLIGFLSCLFVCTRYFKLNLKVSMLEMKLLFKNTIFLFFSSLGMKLQTQSDTFFVGVFLGPQSAAVYGLTIRGYETVRLFVSQIGCAVGPSLANLYGSSENGRFQDVVLKISMILMFLSGVGFAAFAVLNQAFVDLWVGEGLYVGNTTTYVLALAGFIMMTCSAAYDSLTAGANFKLISKIYVSTAVVHLIMLYLLTRFIGLWATPIAHLLSASMFGVIFWMRAKDQYGMSISPLMKILKNALLVIVVVTLVYTSYMYSSVMISDWIDFSLAAIFIIFISSVIVIFACSDIREVVVTEAKKYLKVFG